MAGKFAHDLNEIFLTGGVPFGPRSHEVLVVVRCPGHDLATASQDITAETANGPVHPWGCLLRPFLPERTLRP
jgi:hypothetical protein